MIQPKKKFTFCSNDLVSPDSTYLTTVPEGTNEYCRQYTYYGKQAYTTNTHWNVFTPLTSGLHIALRLAARCANQIVINAAKQVYNVSERRPPAIAHKSRWLVFQGGVFQEFYSGLNSEFFKKQNNAVDNITLLNCSAVVVGRSTWQQDTLFSSVTNPIGDPVSGTWLDVWMDEYESNLRGCASLDYLSGCGNPSIVVGGHVVLGTEPGDVLNGADNVVVMTICTGHRTSGAMKVVQDGRGIDLDVCLLCLSPTVEAGRTVAPNLRIGTAERSLRSHL
jgi:hypothetical protein